MIDVVPVKFNKCGVNCSGDDYGINSICKVGAHKFPKSLNDTCITSYVKKTRTVCWGFFIGLDSTISFTITVYLFFFFSSIFSPLFFLLSSSFLLLIFYERRRRADDS